MDKASSVTAALNAGKLPSQEQISGFLDWFLQCPLSQVEPSSQGGDLSEQGRILIGDIRELLTAYKLLGEHKNGDNLIQQALWHLSQADISATTTTVTDDATKEQANKDASALARAMRTIFYLFWSNFTQESQYVFHDFASFMRLALADAAEYVSSSAGSAAQSLREVDEQVSRGERNELGMKNLPEDEKFKNQDPKEQWERVADTVKVAGSKTIGAGQVAVATSEDVANRSSQRLADAFNQICDRAQDDQQYHDSISTIFDVLSKWLHKSLDTAGDVNTDTSLESFIDDPTPEQHLIKAVRGVRAFLERTAGGKSLDGFFAALRVCGVDVQQDEGIRRWADDALAFARRCLDEREFSRSEDAQQTRDDLQKRWDEMTSQNSEEAHKWRDDVGRLKQEWAEFSQAMGEGEDLKRVRRAGAKFGEDLENAFGTAAAAGAQKALDQPVWMWQDMFNAYLPRLMSVIKDIPIPRTEYKDSDVEFVLEDLDISSFSLLPGHVYIRNITDIDIKAPADGAPETAVGSLTRVFAQGVELALREVSFWFKQKTATMGPSEFSGILELTLPPQAVDIDVVVRGIPSSPEGIQERYKRKTFTEVQRVQVKISDDMQLTIRESNHQVLASVLRPIITARVREALQNVLADNVRSALEWLDSVCWDIGNRAEVFQDAGLSRGPALVAGFWSELGRLNRGDSGLFKGWTATGTGLIKGAGNARPDAQFAMGAEPQVLSGEKRGPRGNFSESLQDKASQAVPEGMDVDSATVEVQQRAREVAVEAKESLKEGINKVRSFKQAVQEKSEQEKNTPGWQSSAFDVSA